MNHHCVGKILLGLFAMLPVLAVGGCDSSTSPSPEHSAERVAGLRKPAVRRQQQDTRLLHLPEQAARIPQPAAPLELRATRGPLAPLLVLVRRAGSARVARLTPVV